MKQIFSTWVEHVIDQATYRQLVLFFHRQDLSPNDLAEKLNDELTDSTPPDEILISVPIPVFTETKNRCKTHIILKTHLDRFSKNSEITLTGFDINGNEVKVSRLTSGKRVPSIPLKKSTRQIITSLFRKYGGFVESNESFHFENPSGRHTKKFLRFSNLLNSSEEIGYIAFACLPFIGSDIERLYIDTPSLHSVTSSINEIRSVFSVRALGVTNFHSYKIIENNSSKLNESTLVMISATSSGGLSKAIEEKYKLEKEKIFHLLFLGDSVKTKNVVCDLKLHNVENRYGVEKYPEVFDKKECEFCKLGSPVVRIIGDQFDITGSQPAPITIKITDAPNRFRKSFSQFLGNKVLTVQIHKATPNKTRDFQVNFENLIRVKEFKRNLEYVLKRFVPSKCSKIIDVSGNSDTLANIVKDFTSANGRNVDILSLDDLYNCSSFNEMPIIVTADVIESGRCLTTVSQALRSNAQDSPVVYIVGVEKISNTHERSMLSKTLKQCNQVVQHGYVAVEKIILPPSTGDNSWIDELNFLKTMRMIKMGDVSDIVEARIMQLQNSAEHMVNNLFLKSLDGCDLNIEKGFVFWPENYDPSSTTQAEVYYTISSVLQQMRTSGKILSAWHHQTRLHPSNFDRFNDGVIRASILRAAKYGELNFSENETESTEMKNIILNAFRSASTPAGYDSPEFLMALGMKKLRLKPDDHNSVVDVGRTMNGVIKELSDFIEKI